MLSQFRNWLWYLRSGVPFVDHVHAQGIYDIYPQAFSGCGLDVAVYVIVALAIPDNHKVCVRLRKHLFFFILFSGLLSLLIYTRSLVAAHL